MKADALPTWGEHLSPRAWYRLHAARPGFHDDPAQREAVEHLERLQETLATRRPGWLPWARPRPVRGLYLWGRVGRGKSFLMDNFFVHVPVAGKRRVHFHRFMDEVHAALKHAQGRRDPLEQVAARLAKTHPLLCLDEFHVTDIGDAMLLGRLLDILIRRGVTLVITSNQPPDGLYPHGLQRERFLPAIALLKAHLDVLEMDGGQDYRLRRLEQAEIYLIPPGAEADARLATLFAELAGDEGDTTPLALNGREIPVRRRGSGVAWLDFAALCRTPRAQADYLALARAFPTLLVSGIPRFGPADGEALRRFMWLVDVLYDERVKLVASAEAPPEALCPAGEGGAEFARTASRLHEMQSRHYLTLPHLPGL